MSIQIYNTLTRKKERFDPLTEGQVTFYLCGPTVYNYIHIGNARSTVAFDTIRRYFKFRGYNVKYVSNFTDVDDKIIKAAKEQGLTTKALSDKYIAAFHKDTGAINVQQADVHPRVIDNMPEIIDYVQTLIDKGNAYESDGDVYFRTKSFADYGKLSHQSTDDLRVGASERTATAETDRKEDALDFALWKQTKDGEISWDSPWGKGRPGWHIECSVMSTKYLGETFDIHGGGQDLEFPHHENEIAQAESHNDQTFANYWMHNGFVTFGNDGEKMSKSLGNFVLLRDLLKEEDPMVIRYLLGAVHYRRPLRYDDKSRFEARTNVERLREVLRRLNHRQEIADQLSAEENQSWLDALDQHKTAFIEVMDDDFNAANGMTVVFDLMKTINHYLEEKTVDTQVLNSMHQLMTELLAVFGLTLETEELLDDAVQTLIDERNQARADRNFQRADEIRDQLQEEGILLDDTPQGTTWKRGN